jgi:sigma-B regulation protein RsbU (phosphoserine phosphatase)
MLTEFRFPPRVGAIPEHVDDVMSTVGAAFDRPITRVALGEVMLNAIVHGALALRPPQGERDPVQFASRIAEAERFCPADRAVEVGVTVGESQAPLVRVRDPGGGFDWRRAVLASEVVPSPTATSGRGLYLVRSGVAKIAWNEAGNEIRLELRRPGEPIRPASIEVARLDVHTTPTRPAPPRKSSSRAPQILVVDDDAVGRRLLHGALRTGGFTVTEAASAFDALDLIRESPPDAIVLDLEMPGMSGVELLDHLREEGLLGRCPVVMITGTEPPPNLQANAIEAGAWHFLIKPISGRELVARVCSVLETQRRIDRLGAERDELRAVDAHVASIVGALLPPRQVSRLGHVVDSQILPARSVGGDLIDIVDVGLLSFAAFLLDVAGSGPPAAMTATAIRCLARDRLMMTGDLRTTLTTINERLYEDFPATRQHVAISVILVDEEAQTISIANAGNPPVVVVTRDDEVILVRSSAPSLGLVRGHEVKIETFDSSKIARIMAPSDGLVERTARPGDSVCALEGLVGRKLDARLAAPSLEELAGHDAARDDASLLFLRVDEESTFDHATSHP